MLNISNFRRRWWNYCFIFLWKCYYLTIFVQKQLGYYSVHAHSASIVFSHQEIAFIAPRRTPAISNDPLFFKSLTYDSNCMIKIVSFAISKSCAIFILLQFLSATHHSSNNIALGQLILDSQAISCR